MYPESLKNLIESFKMLPGIGEKTAERDGHETGGYCQRAVCFLYQRL